MARYVGSSNHRYAIRLHGTKSLRERVDFGQADNVCNVITVNVHDHLFEEAVGDGMLAGNSLHSRQEKVEIAD